MTSESGDAFERLAAPLMPDVDDFDACGRSTADAADVKPGWAPVATSEEPLAAAGDDSGPRPPSLGGFLSGTDNSAPSVEPTPSPEPAPPEIVLPVVPVAPAAADPSPPEIGVPAVPVAAEPIVPTLPATVAPIPVPPPPIDPTVDATMPAAATVSPSGHINPTSGVVGTMSRDEVLAAHAASRVGATPRRSRRGRRAGHAGRVIGTLVLLVVVAGAGLGARLGWQAWNERVDESAPATGPVGEVQRVQDLVASERRPTGTRVALEIAVDDILVDVRVDLVTDEVAIEVTEGAGADESRVEAYAHEASVLLRPEGNAQWWDAAGDEATVEMVRDWRQNAHRSFLMLSDVLPPTALEAATVLVHDREELDVGPLTTVGSGDAARADAAVSPDDEHLSGPAGFADRTRTTTPVDGSSSSDAGAAGGVDSAPTGPTVLDHFRISVDQRLLIDADPAAYARWTLVETLGLHPMTRTPVVVDVWVDEQGVVRQLSSDDLRLTLHAVGDDLAITDGIGRTVVPMPEVVPESNDEGGAS